MKAKLLLLLLLLVGTNVSAQYTSIPDANFEAALINMGIDDIADGKVLKTKIDKLKELNLYKRSITDLTGIQDFVALESLDCHYNKLTALDVSKNTALTTLYCSANQLTALDVSKNTALTTLYCSENELTALDVSKNTALNDLYCYYNQLTTLDVSKNTALTTLYCSKNKLTAIDVSKNTALVSFYCDSNQLTALDASKNTALTTLECRSNKLTALDVSKNTYLVGFYCDSNQLTALDVSKNTALTTLYCSENELTALDVSKNTSLTILQCSKNQLKTLNLSKNTALTTLECRSNQLTALNLKNGKNTLFNYISLTGNTTLSCIAVDDVAYANANWKNKINPTSFFAPYDCSTVTLIPNATFEDKLIALGIDTDGKNGVILNSSINTLTSLDVSNSAIADLTGIEGFTALKSLNVSNNLIITIDLSKSIALTTLNCYYNQLKALDVSKNTALTNLQLNSNLLTNLDVSKNIALTNLNCNSNQLANFDVSNNTNLNELFLSDNALLKTLNLKNGNNSKLSEASISFTENPILKCIQVDDKIYSDTNWATKKDATADYNQDCDPFTAIPDSNFEDKLIALGIDTDGKNGKVLIESINTITTLNVSASTIKDLTGIEKFTALTTLNCSSNQIVTLDISKNKALIDLNCSANKLTSLNCKNNNNSQMADFDAKNNPNLNCIQVNDAIYANTNWSTKKDAIANFNTDCATSNLYTYIPDVNFENKLIELSIDASPADGKVLTASINTLTSLNVSYGDISNLSGIQGFSNLTSLDCIGNQLKNLDLNKNTALTELNCNSNQLVTLNINLCKSLTRLTVGANQLTNLDLSKNTLLTDLNVSTNQLTSLDLKQNLALKAFTGIRNKITTIDLSNNSELESVDCSYNELTTLEIPKSDKLIDLNCEGNKLSTLNINNVTSLNSLNLSSNLLTSLDISKHKVLTQLVCSANQLTYLNISENKVLTDLDCSSNQLKALNLKNGNNINFFTAGLYLDNNPNLSCIKVDDKTYSDTNWSAYKDATATFNTECGLSLSSNNFTVETKAESCQGENNGEINITATEAYSYTASINGENYSFTNNMLSVTNLTPGNYTVSITIPGETFEQNYTLAIAKGTNITGKSSVSSKKVNVEITDGTAPYTVFVNGVEQFESQTSSFSVPAKGGGLLEVKTAKACEGIYTKDITGLDLVVSAYPNPTSGNFEIKVPTLNKEVTIEINTLDGRIISNKKYIPENGKVQLTLINEPNGVYIAKIYLDTIKNVKIIKN